MLFIRQGIPQRRSTPQSRGRWSSEDGKVTLEDGAGDGVLEEALYDGQAGAAGADCEDVEGRGRGKEW